MVFTGKLNSDAFVLLCLFYYELLIVVFVWDFDVIKFRESYSIILYVHKDYGLEELTQT